MNLTKMYVDVPRPNDGDDDTFVWVHWYRDSDEREVIDCAEIDQPGDPDDGTILTLTPAVEEQIYAALASLPDEPYEPDWDALYEDYEYRRRCDKEERN